MPTLLVADDSMFQRFVYSKIGKDAGFEVAEADNGEKCLEICRQSVPDVMILDLNMPGLSGIQVLEKLKEDGIQTTVLVVTADIQDTTKERCKELGATDFLNKPVHEDTLRKKLEQYAS